MKVLNFWQSSDKQFLENGNTNCFDNKDFNPYGKILEKLTEEMECSPPWTKKVSNDLKICKTKEYFDKYFQTLKDFQDELRHAPKKCKYRTWHVRDQMTEHLDGNTGMKLIMAMQNDQV